MRIHATRRDIVGIGLLGMLIGALLAAILVSTQPADAANGDALRMGQKNYAGKNTLIKGKSMYTFQNTTTGGEPAARFVVKSGPPIAVNSAAMVSNLNADLLDGKDALAFRHEWAWVSNPSIGNSANWSTATKTLMVYPGGGVILMQGSVTFVNTKTTSDWVGCAFYVDGSLIEASYMQVHAQPNEYGTCSSTAAYSASAGAYDVRFSTSGASVANIELDNGFWWATTIPNP